MSVLVTGATGFIGRKLIQELLNNGEKVHILCRSTSNISGLEDPNIKIFTGDILDISSIAQAMEGCDQVYHMAALAKNWAPDPNIFYKINVQGTENILNTAKNVSVKRIVITSTSMTFRPSNGDPVDESSGRSDHILTDYARTKAKAEDIILSYCNQGLPVVAVNPTRIFGPGFMTEGNSTTLMVQLYLQGKFRFILGDGNAIGNYGYVDDIVRGHIQAMDHGKSGEFYILGGENLSFNDFFNVVSEVSEIRHYLFHIPISLIQFFSRLELARAKLFRGYPLITPEWVKVFSMDWGFSCNKAEKEIGYNITPFHEAMTETINWLTNPQQKNEIIS
jgi:nucleoside-diphosphate-sugar epimerase